METPGGKSFCLFVCFSRNKHIKAYNYSLGGGYGYADGNKKEFPEPEEKSFSYQKGSLHNYKSIQESV